MASYGHVSWLLVCKVQAKLIEDCLHVCRHALLAVISGSVESIRSRGVSHLKFGLSNMQYSYQIPIVQQNQVLSVASISQPVIQQQLQVPQQSHFCQQDPIQTQQPVLSHSQPVYQYPYQQFKVPQVQEPVYQPARQIWRAAGLATYAAKVTKSGLLMDQNRHSRETQRCYICNQFGHNSSRCPLIQCRKRLNFGHKSYLGFNTPIWKGF